MKIIYAKKDNVIVCAGHNIVSHDEYNFLDEDTNTYYSNNTFSIADIDAPDNDILVYPTKYQYNVDTNTISNNPYFKEPYTFSENMYNNIQSSIDYLMLLNDPDSASE